MVDKGNQVQDVDEPVVIEVRRAVLAGAEAHHQLDQVEDVDNAVSVEVAWADLDRTEVEQHRNVVAASVRCPGDLTPPHPENKSVPFLQRRLKGLIEAAETAAKMAAPITTAVKAILDLFPS